MTISFVLAGGGSLGAAQVGMLRALNEAGVRPDLLVGASAGAINAFCYAQHPTTAGLDRLQRLWHRMHRKAVFPLDVVQIMAGLTGLRDGFVPPDKLRSFLDRNLTAARLDDALIPIHVVATDLADGQPVVLSEGAALDALMASSAIPGVFPPVEIDGRPLVDGGVSVTAPVRQAEDLGSTLTYVLPTVGPTDPELLPHGAIPVLLHAVSHLFGRVASNEMAAAHHEVRLLPAPTQAGANMFDFGDTDELIETAYCATARALSSARSSARPIRPTGRPAARRTVA